MDQPSSLRSILASTNCSSRAGPKFDRSYSPALLPRRCGRRLMNTGRDHQRRSRCSQDDVDEHRGQIGPSANDGPPPRHRATGILLHTNLGGADGKKAAKAKQAPSTTHLSDCQTGKRGDRLYHVKASKL